MRGLRKAKMRAGAVAYGMKDDLFENQTASRMASLRPKNKHEEGNGT